MEGCLSRFLSSFYNYQDQATDAPYDFGYAGGLTCLSTIALGRKWIDRGSGIRPNLFTMLVAGSSDARKSTSIKNAQSVIEQVEEDRIGPDDFTPEGLVYYMRKRSKGSQGGIRNKLLIPIEEYGEVLARAGSYASGLTATLCKLYDGSDYERIRSGKRPVLVPKPRLSIFAACALGMFEKFGNSNDWATGFYPRFLFVTPRERPAKKPAAPPKPKAAFDDTVLRLKALRDQLKANPGPMPTTSAAETLQANFANTLPESDDPVIAAIRERYLNTVWKVAILYQIDEDPDQAIGAQSMTYAIWWMERCWQSFQLVYNATAGSEFTRVLRRVNQKIKDTGDDGITKRDLLRIFTMSSEKLLPILDILLKMGAVYTTRGPPGPRGGRPQEVLVAAKG